MLHPRLHQPRERLWWNQCLGAIQYSNVSLVHRGKQEKVEVVEKKIEVVEKGAE